MSQTKSPLSSAQLEAQKKDASSRLSALRQKQIEALENGEAFEHNSEIVIETALIAALEEAVARAVVREEREFRRQERIGLRDKAIRLRENMEAAEAVRLADLQALEEATSAFVAAIKRYQQSAEEARKACSVVCSFYNKLPDGLKMARHIVYSSYDSDIPFLTADQINTRLGDYLSDKMKAISENTRRIGSVQWESSGAEADRWVSNEKRLGENMIARSFSRQLDFVARSIPQDGGND